MKWDLEKEAKKQSAPKIMRRHFPFSLLIGEIEIIIKGETTKAFINTGATLSVLNPTQLNYPLP